LTSGTQATTFTDTTVNQSTDKLLKEIRHLLKTQKQEQHYEADQENETKNDWILAAAVLDRICAIAFTVTLVAGTITFFVIFAIHL